MNNNTDTQHLKLLSIFHYLVGGIILFFFLAALIYATYTINLFYLIDYSPIESSRQSFPPDYLKYYFALSIAIIIFQGAVAIATILSGRFLKLHKRYWFSFVTACFLCLYTPFGTILGVFTLIVLCRQSVKELYSENLK